MINEYTQEDKEKYVKGFNNCHLTIGDYCEKMQINVQDLKQWLKEIRKIPSFGEIKVAELTSEIENVSVSKNNEEATTCITPSSTPSTTAIKFETDTIKIELKPNFDKAMLVRLIDAVIQ